MSIKMNTKKSKRNSIDTAVPINNNNKKRPKNDTVVETENDLINKKQKKKENVNVAPNQMEGSNIGRKRKQTDANAEISDAKKQKKKFKPGSFAENIDIQNMLTPSGTNNIDRISSTATPFTKKAKNKISNEQTPLLMDHNGSLNGLELTGQQNGKRRTKPNDYTSGETNPFHNMNTSFNCQEEERYNNSITVKDEPLRSDANVVNITLKDLEDTDSDINEKEIFTELGKKDHQSENAKATAPKKEVISWCKEDLKKLIDRMEACIPENDILAFSTRAEKLEWDAVSRP